MNKIIAQAKDYQLAACYNRMNKLGQDYSDNLTDEITRTVKSLITIEVSKRNLILTKENSGYYTLSTK